MKNLAIIGIGYWGKKLIREYSKISNIVVCCSSGNKNNIAWLKKNYPKIKHTNNFDKILNDSTVEGIIIATPIRTHFKLAYQSLKKGKHVFVEKTMAENYSDAKKLFSMAKQNKLVLFVGNIFLYHPVLEKLRQLTKKEKLFYAKLNWLKLGSFKENMLLDLVSHFISIQLELMGEPQSVSVLDSKGFLTNNDMITIESKFSNNRKCVIDINRNSSYKKRSITLITKKNLFLWDDEVLFKFNKKTLSFDNYFSSNNTPLEIECKEFVCNIKNKKIDYSNAEKAVKIMKILTEKIRI